MKIVYTKHAQTKLREEDAVKLSISKKKIADVLNTPITTDTSRFPHIKVGKLRKDLSLCVIYKLENDTMIVITFYPAEKGRYESKILSRR